MVDSKALPSLERSPGKHDNWVENAGGLPSYIERIAKHLHYEKGMEIGHAIAVAVNACRRMCGTGDLNYHGIQHVKPQHQAEACAAIADWEAKKVKAHVSKGKRLHLTDEEIAGLLGELDGTPVSKAHWDVSNELRGWHGRWIKAGSKSQHQKAGVWELQDGRHGLFVDGKQTPIKTYSTKSAAKAALQRHLAHDPKPIRGSSRGSKTATVNGKKVAVPNKVIADSKRGRSKKPFTASQVSAHTDAQTMLDALYGYKGDKLTSERKLLAGITAMSWEKQFEKFNKLDKNQLSELRALASKHVKLSRNDKERRIAYEVLYTIERQQRWRADNNMGHLDTQTQVSVKDVAASLKANRGKPVKAKSLPSQGTRLKPLGFNPSPNEQEIALATEANRKSRYTGKVWRHQSNYRQLTGDMAHYYAVTRASHPDLESLGLNPIQMNSVLTDMNNTQIKRYLSLRRRGKSHNAAFNEARLVNYRIASRSMPTAEAIAFYKAAFDEEQEGVRFKIEKRDDDLQIAFGYATLAIDANGNVQTDHSGDFIDNPEDVEKAAYDYALQSRDGGLMHLKKGVATMVESFAITKEKKAAMGIPQESLPDAAWWIGLKVHDSALWHDIKSGKYPMFSVEGTGYRTVVEA